MTVSVIAVARDFFRLHRDGRIFFPQRPVRRPADQRDDDGDKDNEFRAAFALGFGRIRLRRQNRRGFHTASLPECAANVQRGN